MLKSVQRTEEKGLLKYLSFQVRHGLSLEQALQNIGFRKEGAERKEILDDMEKNGVVPQEYMDETIRQNLELKKQLFTAKNERNAFKIYSDGAEADAIKLNEQLTKAREIILKLYNAGRDVLMCRAEEKAYDNLSNAINDRSIEKFLQAVSK